MVDLGELTSIFVEWDVMYIVHRQLLCYFVLSQTKINLMSMQDTI